MIFNLQFNLMFGTPERLFGEGFAQPLSHQAYCYITEGNDNV